MIKQRPKDNIKVTSVTEEGFRIVIKSTEYNCPFDKFRWFRNATVEQIQSVEGDAEWLHWEELDMDLGERNFKQLSNGIRYVGRAALNYEKAKQVSTEVKETTGKRYTRILLITAKGFCVGVGLRKYFFTFDDYPWFRDVKVSEIMQVEGDAGYIQWKDLGFSIDISELPVLYRRHWRYWLRSDKQRFAAVSEKGFWIDAYSEGGFRFGDDMIHAHTEKFFLSFNDHPYFYNTTVDGIMKFEYYFEGYLHWIGANIFVHIDAIKHTQSYPLHLRAMTYEELEAKQKNQTEYPTPLQ